MTLSANALVQALQKPSLASSGQSPITPIQTRAPITTPTAAGANIGTALIAALAARGERGREREDTKRLAEVFGAQPGHVPDNSDTTFDGATVLQSKDQAVLAALSGQLDKFDSRKMQNLAPQLITQLGMNGLQQRQALAAEQRAAQRAAAAAEAAHQRELALKQTPGGVDPATAALRQAQVGKTQAEAARLQTQNNLMQSFVTRPPQATPTATPVSNNAGLGIAPREQPMPDAARLAAASGDLSGAAKIMADQQINAPNAVARREQAKVTGKKRAELRAALEEAAVNASSTIARLDGMEELNGKTATGIFAEGRLTIGKLLQAAGLPEDTFGISGDVGAAEAFRSLTTNQAMSLVQQTKGAVSDAEMKMFTASVPGLVNTRDGNQMIIDFMRTSTLRQREIGRAVSKIDIGNFNADTLIQMQDAAREKFPIPNFEAVTVDNPVSDNQAGGFVPLEQLNLQEGVTVESSSGQLFTVQGGQLVPVQPPQQPVFSGTESP